MSSLNFDVYEAFKAAGVPDDKARKAAEALAERDVPKLEKLSDDMITVKTRLAVHTAMLGVILAGIVALVTRAYLPPV